MGSGLGMRLGGELEATLPGKPEWPENEATMCFKHRYTPLMTDRQTDRQTGARTQPTFNPVYTYACKVLITPLGNLLMINFLISS